MTDQPRRNGGGRRRTQDEANLTHEEAVKKQKNREAARKHREKKEKTLMALKQENEVLEAKNEEYTAKQKKLKELIAQAERQIFLHKQAGCCLPEDLRNLKSLTDQSLHSRPVVVTSASSTDVHAMEEDELEKNPMALFSGESLPLSVPQTSVKSPQPRARHNSLAGSMSAEKVYRCSPPLGVSHTSLTSQQVLASVGGHQGQGQDMTQLISTLNFQGQESVKFKANSNYAPVIASNINNSVVHQNMDQTAITSFFQVNGNACRLLVSGGHHHIVGNPDPTTKQETVVETDGETSPMSPDDHSLMAATQIYPAQTAMSQGSRSSLTGNIPAAELLEGVGDPTHELNHDENTGTTVNYSRQDSYSSDEHQSREFQQYSSSLPEQESSPYERYSYTDDLNLSEPPQRILRQINSQTFQQHTGSASGAMAQSEPSLYPDPIRSAPGSLHPAPDMVRESNFGETPNFRSADQGDERTTRYLKTHVACAPAILDMLSEAQVQPSLQDEIKKSLIM